MTITLVIILTLLFIITGYLLLRRKEFLKQREIQETISILDRTGALKLKEEDQFNILLHSDLTSIRKLSPELSNRSIPFSIVGKYISTTKENFKEYLKNKDFLEQNKLENAPNPKHDGIWWNGKNIIDQEHGHVHQEWKAPTENDALDVYVDLLWKKIEMK